MHLHLATPQTPSNEGHEIIRAVNLVDTINEEVKKAISSLDEVDLSDKNDVEVLLTEANMLGYDLHKVCYKLKRISIVTFRDGKGHSDLVQVIQNFNNLTRKLVCVSQKNYEELRNELKEILTDLVSEVDKLLNVVKNNESNDSKRDIVDVINLISNAVENITLRNKYHKVALVDMLSLLDNRFDWFSNILYNVKIENQYVVRNLVRSITFGSYRMFVVENKLFEDALDCNEENLQKSLLKICHYINEALCTLNNSYQVSNNLKYLQLTTQVCAHCMFTLVSDAITAIIHSQGDKPDIQNKVLFYIIQTISLANALARGLTHVASVQEA